MFQREYKMSLFADDFLLTLTNLHISLPSLYALLSKFSTISEYKINTSKLKPCPYTFLLLIFYRLKTHILTTSAPHLSST